MRAVLIVVLATTPVLAEPATPEQFEACKARRRDMAAEAMKIPDANARGARLAELPTCERRADGTLDVTAPPPPVVDTTPFAPRVVLAARLGASASTILSNEVQPSGFGPYVEIEAGYHLRRHVELGAMIAYASFHDASAFDIVAGQNVDVRELSVDAAARASARYGDFAFGGGVGIEYERYANTSFSTVLPLLELHAAYAFAHARALRAQVFASATDGNTLFASGFHGDLVSVRLGVGVAY